MRRWIRALAPCALVASMNALAAFPEGPPNLLRLGVRASQPYSYAVLAAAALGAALLGLARARSLRPWAVLVPLLPVASAAAGMAAMLYRTQSAALDAIAPVWPISSAGWAREVFAEAGALRALGAFEGLTLALALVASLAPAWWPREGVRRAPAVLAALTLALTTTVMCDTLLVLRHADKVSPIVFMPALFALLAPPLMALTLRAPTTEPASSAASTPYRAPPEVAPAERALDAPSVALMAALLTPWMAYESLRGAVAIAGTSHFAWSNFELDTYAVGQVRETLLALATRWRWYMLPFGVASALVALARGADRRAVRAWAVGALLVVAGDSLAIARQASLKHAVDAMASHSTWLWSPGAAWLERAPDPAAQPREELRWSASGAVEAVAPAERSGDWRVGPLVHLDDDLSGYRWESHLRRWRAASRGDALTVFSRCARGNDPWLDDPRHEVSPAESRGITACHIVVEVAREPVDLVDPAGSVVRVTGEWSASVGGLAVDLHTWRASGTTVWVVPDGDFVPGATVARAANRLRDGRTRVLLGWTNRAQR